MKKFFLLALLLVPLVAMATGLTTDQKYLLNHMNDVALKVGLGDAIDAAKNVSNLPLAQGNIIVGNGSGVGAALSAKTSGRILVGSGTTVASVAVSGDATLASSGALTVANGAITNAKMAANTLTNASALQGSDGLLLDKVLRATYDFSVNGGAQGSLSLGQSFPANAIIKRCYFYVKTRMTSATNAAKIALQAEGAGDIYAAATANTPTVGSFNAGIEDGTTTNMVITTASRALTLVISNGENLTAGKFVVFCSYDVAL